MLGIIKKILKRKYNFLNTIEISKTNLVNNYNYLSSLNSNFKIAPVLKSNAYGHGLVEVAKILDSQKAPYFCVDSLHEAYRLYKENINTPILIMGYFDPNNLRFKKPPFTYAVSDLEIIKKIYKYQQNASLHIKLDTGMHRLGIQVKDLDQFLKEINKMPELKIEGVMSHFASAENLKDPLLINQVNNFYKALEIFKQNGINPKWKHISASKAILNTDISNLLIKECNMGRAGRALYGIIDKENHPKLKPVLKLKTKIAQIKIIEKGEKVGYDGTFEAPQNMVIGILPIGYYDGVDRRLSNKGYVTVNNIACPIIGRVSMNITTIDLTSITNPKINQEVTVFSDNSEDPNSLENSANLCGTIPHELLIHLVFSTNRITV